MTPHERKSFYLTTTLPYVNDKPHIGFALELVQADTIARWKKLAGHEVFFNTGTDEHGQKVWNKAKELGKDIQEYVDEYAANFKNLIPLLGLSEDIHFIRTTDPKHVEAAQELWRRSMAKGDIYKKKYKGLYCVGDEAFVKESDLVNGRCPNHPNLELQEIEEENYFFKLSNYKEQLREYLNAQTIIPDWRRGEALNALLGMEDFSISREKKRLEWGVPVPEDDTQVMYVWFDALIAYISTLGWPNEEEDYKKFWEEGYKLQLAGKDQVKFQSVIWQAMLMSAGLPNTDLVFYHGFINSGGQKMSKSIGNVIGPDELIKEYGADALRYYLARHVSTFEDSDVTPESFKEAYNGNLANGLGNLVSRIMKLAETNLDAAVEVPEYQSHRILESALEKFDIHRAINHIWDEIGELDREIQTKKPWESKDKEVITGLVVKLAHIGHSLAIFMPATSEKILAAIKSNKLDAGLFPRKD
jgi:methionyl-tRNA synthetase